MGVGFFFAAPASGASTRTAPVGTIAFVGMGTVQEDFFAADDGGFTMRNFMALTAAATFGAT